MWSSAPTQQHATVNQKANQNQLASGTLDVADFTASHRGLTKPNFKKAKSVLQCLYFVMFTSTWLMTQDAGTIMHIALVVLSTSYFILFPVEMHECICSHAVRLKFHAVFHGSSLKALPAQSESNFAQCGAPRMKND